MKRIALLVCVYAVICLASGVTLVRAQTQPDHPKLDPKACADRERLALADTHGSQGPRIRETDGANPGEKLARTDGVLCPPPDIDPNIHAPAPGGGRTPVIPPAAVEPGTQAK
jgi:hypothetical protein